MIYLGICKRVVQMCIFKMYMATDKYMCASFSLIHVTLNLIVKKKKILWLSLLMTRCLMCIGNMSFNVNIIRLWLKWNQPLVTVVLTTKTNSSFKNYYESMSNHNNKKCIMVSLNILAVNVAVTDLWAPVFEAKISESVSCLWHFY